MTGSKKTGRKKIEAYPIESVISQVERDMQENLDSNAKEKLTNLLYSTIKGRSDIIYSALGLRYDTGTVLDDWLRILKRNAELMEDVLIDLEDTEVEKFGPRSIAKPWFPERQKALDEFYEQIDVDYSVISPSPPESLKHFNLRPLSVYEASKYIKRSTNSGLPYMGRKGDYIDVVLKDFNDLLEAAKQHRLPCVIFTRTQDSAKTRNVYGVPLVVVLNEMTYYRPLLKVQKDLPWRCALRGPYDVANHMTRIIDEGMRTAKMLISIDFSAFDSTVKPGMQAKVGEYYKNLFQSKYSDEIDSIIALKSTIPIVTPEGVRYGGHGEPSGSAFTNEDDSIAQFLVARRSGVLDESLNLFAIQGDDGVYAIDPEKVPTFLKVFENFFKINLEKTKQTSNHLFYLQNLYHPFYRKEDGTIPGVYSTVRALNRILYQERFTNFVEYELKGKDYYALRTLSILENCKNHPLFRELVEFVFGLDKYDLSPSSDSIANYVRLINDTEGFRSSIPQQYGDNVSGIKDWESYKIVQELLRG
uniref:RdRp n=1 Tax=viral metagenome TaxID=1070528 RepID=A0A8J9SD49_9ZZZZ